MGAKKAATDAAAKSAANAAVAEGTLAASTETAGAAATTAGGGMAGLGAAIGSVIIPIAIVAAALVGLGVAIYFLIENSKKEQKEIDNLNKAFEEFSSEADKTKQELNDLTSTFDKYNELVDSLYACERGSEEWNKKLKEVNDSTLEILAKYPELLKLSNLYTTIGGTQTLNQKTIDEYLKNKSTQQEILQLAALSAKTNASNKQVALDQKNLSKKRDALVMKTKETYMDDGYSYATEIDRLNSYDLVPDEVKKKIEQSFDGIADTAQKVSDADLERMLKETGATKDYIDEVKKYSNDVKKLSKETEEAATQMQNAARAMGKIIGDEGESAAEDILQGQEYNKKQEEIQKEVYDSLTGGGISKASGGDNEKYKAALKRLQQVEGFENFTADRNGVRGVDTNRSLAFRDAEGKEVVYTAEKVAQLIASSEAKSYVESDERKNAIRDRANKANVGLMNAVGDRDIADAIVDSDIKSLSEEQINKLKQAMTDGVLQSNISDDLLKILGYETKDALINHLKNEIEE